MEKSLHMDQLTLGVCYYPEHWPKELWPEDLKRMEEYGIKVIRIAEFAWNKFEPEEGVFTFEFFDEFMNVVKDYNIKVIFCTPTATPPAWLTEKYPDTLNANIQGVLYRHGQRRQYNYNSENYRRFSARITEKLAKHYGNHPSIIGWQIDNELNCEIDVFYSEADHAAFRTYVKEKYQTLERLNECWGTTFWNQTYTDWGQVYLDRPTPSYSGNPHKLLDEKRFISHSAISFCKMQSDILRKNIDPKQFITTNGVFTHLDSHEMTDTALDFITYDSYPNFAPAEYSKPLGRENLMDRKWGRNLSQVRSISPNFGIMEQQSGANGWVNTMAAPSPKPGQMRLWTFQSVAHGADYVSYFRFRTCWIGTEIYWHGLLDYSNEPGRKIEELRQIHSDFVKLGDVAGSRYQADFAVIRDYDNEWDGEFDRWHGEIRKLSEDGIFKASQYTHTPMDFLYLRKSTTLEELSRYKALFYPHATILEKETADLLKQYVEQGGLLIFGARTGYKDIHGRCPMRPMPGHVADLCGIKVKDFTIIGPYDNDVPVTWGNKTVYTQKFNDILEVTAPDTKVLATFGETYYAGEAALTERAVGKGKVYYFGAGFHLETAELFLEQLALSHPYSDSIDLPEECELAVRKKGEKSYFFVLNYLGEPTSVTLKKEMKDVLNDKVVTGTIPVAPYGVSVFTL